MPEKKVGKRSFGYLAFLLASLFEGDLQAGDAPCRLRREEGDGDRNAVEGVYKKLLQSRLRRASFLWEEALTEA